MIRRRILVSIVLLIPALAASDLLAQCEGSASAATTYTQHFNCSDPRKARRHTGLDRLGLPLRPTFSGRVEEADGLRYVMEDWAVVGLDAAGAAKVLSPAVDGGSSPRPAPKRFASMGGRYSGSPTELASIGLVIAPPHHPRNSRHIPAPAIALRPARLPDPGERITAAVRIDLGEDRAIRDAQLLYTVGRLPSGIDLAKEVRDHLDVRYASEQQHRVVVFAIVDVEGGAMELRDSEIVLPLCCCHPICK